MLNARLESKRVELGGHAPGFHELRGARGLVRRLEAAELHGELNEAGEGAWHLLRGSRNAWGCQRPAP